jgi:2-isopropylmalate synthase
MKEYPNEFSIKSYSEHSCGDKSSAKAVAYIQIDSPEIISCFGVGEDNDITMATIKALFSALNRAFAPKES